MVVVCAEARAASMGNTNNSAKKKRLKRMG
jgi:hypothetical protein